MTALLITILEPQRQNAAVIGLLPLLATHGSSGKPTWWLGGRRNGVVSGRIGGLWEAEWGREGWFPVPLVCAGSYPCSFLPFPLPYTLWT